MAIYDETVADVLYYGSVSEIYTESTSPYYGNLTNAGNYFKTKLDGDTWFDANLFDQENSLREATRRIEALNLAGTKVSEDQLLHFPTEEKGTPKAIYIATYEIALKLLDGREPDREVDALSTTLKAYAGFRTMYDRSTVQEHIRAGIPSAYAWSILRPYLCDALRVKLRKGV
jgi:hypothetical protein